MKKINELTQSEFAETYRAYRVSRKLTRKRAIKNRERWR